MIGELTHKQATTLAAFLAELRTDWDKAGIVSALGKARTIAPAADLAVAAIRAASTASNRTPSVIGMEGPHWRSTETKPRHETPRQETCGTCYLARHQCEARWSEDHAFESLAHPDRRSDVSERVKQLRQAIARTEESA